ncbi:MAG: DUF3450 domain-containing protein [Methylococcaceae bacterium]
MSFHYSYFRFAFFCSWLCLFSPSLLADALKQAIETDLVTNQANAKSQKKIDGLSDHTQKMLDQYRSVTHQTDTLKTYNQYLQNLTNTQSQDIRSLTKQLQQIEITQREIVPLLLRMLDSLKKFVAMDMPFLPKERQNRVNQLQKMMVRADVTSAEKYRRILEAFQIENDYGNSIEAYRDDLQLNDQKATVDLLRVGRIALFYQRLDGEETGAWNKETKHWDVLPTDYQISVRNGLRIARKQMAPDLLVLPIAGPEEAQ